MTRTQSKRTLEQRAFDVALDRWHPPAGYVTAEQLNASRKERSAFADGWLAGYPAGKREGKAEAMAACGWGDRAARRREKK